MKLGRGFLGVLLLGLAVVLGGCAGSSDTGQDFYIRSTIEATYGGKPVEGSAVLYQKYKYTPRNYTRGEATIIELGNGKRVYHVMVDREFRHFYIGVLYNTFGPKYEKPSDLRNTEKLSQDGGRAQVMATPIGSIGFYDQIRGNAKELRRKFRGYPLLVAFRDENNPQSVFLVETDKPTMLFGKRFEYKNLNIERLPKTELTREIHKILPWVDPKHPYWEGRSARIFSDRNGLVTIKNATDFQNGISRDYFVSTNRRY